ncbi:GntR family transcriptional regulator [Loigolactobacillus jiayinensis]|uniref:GntR family transcriptional regulator n=1 Tax=Loigolactobacillus jiayinensis TaxID=2486016 RepID=A0ABW1RAT7_9LACO|nr:GntR family transcriptional regulator [Loigolactobacillus jiayinensis]
MADNLKAIKGLASDYAYEVLYNKIISIDLAPGTSVSPTQLSKNLGISRTPIQRACTKLAENGLLEVLPQRGSYVSLININRVYESFYMRNLLEQAAIQQVCGLNDRNKVAFLLEQNIYNQRKALEHNLYEKYFEYDNNFHHIIYNAANMLYIEQAMAQVSLDQNRIRQLKILSNIRIDPTLNEHQKILDSIKSGDADAASFNIYVHISKFAEDTISIHEKYPDYFSNWKSAQDIKPSLQKQNFYGFGK